jgi:hypothetical protein
VDPVRRRFKIVTLGELEADGRLRARITDWEVIAWREDGATGWLTVHTEDRDDDIWFDGIEPDGTSTWSDSYWNLFRERVLMGAYSSAFMPAECDDYIAVDSYVRRLVLDGALCRRLAARGDAFEDTAVYLWHGEVPQRWSRRSPLSARWW